jgi:hypothetical protein
MFLRPQLLNLNPFQLVIKCLCHSPSPPGDFNGHMFTTSPTRADVLLRALDAEMTGQGFSRFPSTERPFTFRSGDKFSTINYAFTRNIATTHFQVARLALPYLFL